jgi:hypothetical protein
VGKLNRDQLEGLFDGVQYAGRHQYAGVTYLWTESWLADSSYLDLDVDFDTKFETFEIEDSLFGTQLRSSMAAERYPIGIDEELYWMGDPKHPMILRRIGNFTTINLWARAARFEALMKAFEDADDVVLDPWRNQLVWLYNDRLFPAAILKATELEAAPHTITDCHH